MQNHGNRLVRFGVIASGRKYISIILIVLGRKYKGTKRIITCIRNFNLTTYHYARSRLSKLFSYNRNGWVTVTRRVKSRKQV